MLIEGQEFIDKQDELSCLTFMRKYGMPERINTEVFISMAKVCPPSSSSALALAAAHNPHTSASLLTLTLFPRLASPKLLYC